MAKPRRESVNIASSAAVSGTFSFQGQRITAVIIPAAWTAADLTFDVEEPIDTFVKVVNRAGAAYKLTGLATSASEYHMISGDANQGDVIITSHGDGRVVSTNTGSEADTNQTASRDIIIYLVDV